MSKKKEYVPPVADMILLAPCETLADTSDWGFGNAWREEWGRFDIGTVASGIAFGGSDFDDMIEDDGFFIKKTTN